MVDNNSTNGTSVNSTTTTTTFDAKPDAKAPASKPISTKAAKPEGECEGGGAREQAHRPRPRLTPPAPFPGLVLPPDDDKKKKDKSKKLDDLKKELTMVGCRLATTSRAAWSSASLSGACPRLSTSALTTP